MSTTISNDQQLSVPQLSKKIRAKISAKKLFNFGADNDQYCQSCSTMSITISNDQQLSITISSYQSLSVVINHYQ